MKRTLLTSMTLLLASGLALVNVGLLGQAPPASAASRSVTVSSCTENTIIYVDSIASTEVLSITIGNNNCASGDITWYYSAQATDYNVHNGNTYTATLNANPAGGNTLATLIKAGKTVSLVMAGGVTRADKVTICHRTRSTTNPYVLITVAASSIINNSGGAVGHGNHNTTLTNQVNPQSGLSGGSGVFNSSYSYPANKKWWGDIIPPFVDNQTSQSYAGLNWTGTNPISTSSPGDAGKMWITKTNFFAAFGGSSGCTSSTKKIVATADGTNLTAQEFFDSETKEGQDPQEIVDELADPIYDPEQDLNNSPTTQSNAPTLSSLERVATTPATGVSTTSANLNGDLKNGTFSNTNFFEYRPQSGDGTLTSTSPTIAGGTAPALIPRSFTLTGLTCNTAYEYRIVGDATSGSRYYGGFKSFNTSACSGGGGSSPTPEPSASASSSTSPANNPTRPANNPGGGNRPPATVPPGSNPGRVPGGGSTLASGRGTVTVTPTVSLPPPSGTTWSPGSTRLLNPNTNRPVRRIVTPQGTWTVDPQTGAVRFTPARGFVGTAVLRVRLTGRDGKLYIRPMTFRVAANSRTLVLSGDVPGSIAGGG